MARIEEMLTLADVRAVTKVHSSTIYRWVDRGEFPPPHSYGRGTVRWMGSEVADWQRGKWQSAA